MKGWLLLACLLVCTGCNARVQGAETVLALHTLAGGVGSVTTQGCVYILGTLVGTRGMSIVLAHGGISVKECIELEMFIPSPPSPPPQ